MRHSPNFRVSPHWFLQHRRVRVVDRTVLGPALSPVHFVVGHGEASHFGPRILGAPGLDVKRRRGCHGPCTGWVEVTATGADSSGGPGSCKGMGCCAADGSRPVDKSGNVRCTSNPRVCVNAVLCNPARNIRDRTSAATDKGRQVDNTQAGTGSKR